MDPDPDRPVPTATSGETTLCPAQYAIPLLRSHLHALLTRVEGRCSRGSEPHNHSAGSRGPGVCQCPFLSSLTLLGPSLPMPPTLPSLLGGIVMVVIEASLLLCPPPHSHHHLPLPHPPSNICVFQRPAWEDLSSNHTGLPLVQEQMAFHLARTLAPAPPEPRTP